MANIEMSTCKLHLPLGTTREQVEALLEKHTKQGTIATFVAEHEVGCNKYSFAVVDVPESILSSLAESKLVSSLDPMKSFAMPAFEECAACPPTG